MTIFVLYPLVAVIVFCLHPNQNFALNLEILFGRYANRALCSRSVEGDVGRKMGNARER